MGNIVYMTGFEAGASTDSGIAPDYTSGSALFDTDIVNSGKYSLKITGEVVIGVPGIVKTTQFGPVSNIVFYIYINDLPVSTSTLFEARGSGTNEVFNTLKLNSNGTIGLYDGNTLVRTSTISLSTKKWVKVEIHIKAYGGAGYQYGYIYGFNLDNETGLSDAAQSTNNSVTDLSELVFNTGGTTGTYIDDLYLADPGGTGFAEPATTVKYRILPIKPISDIQVGSWTGGAGGTTNLYDAINNFPPLGTATETNLTQIESADSSGDNSTDEYTCGLEPYNTVGSGTKYGVQFWVCSGEDIGTGTKNGSFSATLPTVSVTTFVFGNDVGALGTFPANWTWKSSICTSLSGVSTTETPTVSVRKTDTGTRVSSICSIFAYVCIQATLPAPSRVFSRPILNF